MYTATIQEHIEALDQHSAHISTFDTTCAECGRKIPAGTKYYEDYSPPACVDCGHRGAIYILDSFERVDVRARHALERDLILSQAILTYDPFALPKQGWMFDRTLGFGPRFPRDRRAPQP